MRIDLHEGFYLDAVREGDQPAYVEHLRDKRTVDCLLKIPYPYTAADAEWWVRHCLELLRTEPNQTHFAIRRPDGFLIGGIGLVPNASIPHRAELGYWLARDYRRRGVATAAARAVTGHGFEILGLQRIEATAFTANTISQGVLEKAGFTREGILKGYHLKDGRLIDACMYACLAPGAESFAERRGTDSSTGPDAPN
jgi:ribosomal-protein-alanine N-acetyltransferase